MATWLYAPTGGVSEIVFPCTDSIPEKLRIGLEFEITDLLVDDGGCARTEGKIERSQAPVTAELGSGETLEQRYAVAGNGQNLDDSCPPADTYRVECPYHHSDPIEEYGRWGFEMELVSQDS